MVIHCHLIRQQNEICNMMKLQAVQNKTNIFQLNFFLVYKLSTCHIYNGLKGLKCKQKNQQTCFDEKICSNKNELQWNIRLYFLILMQIGFERSKLHLIKLFCKHKIIHQVWPLSITFRSMENLNCTLFKYLAVKTFRNDS